MESDKHKTIESIVELLYLALDNRALEHGQREILEKSVRKLVHGVRTNESKRVQRAVDRIARVFLRSK